MAIRIVIARTRTAATAQLRGLLQERGANPSGLQAARWPGGSRSEPQGIPAGSTISKGSDSLRALFLA